MDFIKNELDARHPIRKHLDLIPQRQKAFGYLYIWLKSLQRPVNIIETGTVRERGNYQGDGQSTLYWDLVLKELGGRGASIDLDIKTALTLKLDRMSLLEGDSIIQLRNLPKSFIRSCDLLYLDSFDWDEKNAEASAVHHLAELAAVWTDLPRGCLIAVDDCHSHHLGKHVEVEKFMLSRNLHPEIRSYVTVWCKH